MLVHWPTHLFYSSKENTQRPTTNSICSKLFAFYLLFLAAHSISFSQGIVINEFMAINETTIADMDGEYSDWIEFYNSTEEAINLSGYTLSDDPEILDKWTFPDVSIPADDYLLIFASSKNITEGEELHTNFKISSDGEELFLVNPDGLILDYTKPFILYPDETYGCLPDGAPTVVRHSIPSPNGTNNLYNEFTFSHQSGFYSTGFDFQISSLLGDSIRYTLDGTVPTIESEPYSDFIKIENQNNSPNSLSEIPTSPEGFWTEPSSIVPKATVVRYASFKDGELSSDIKTQTFFVGDKDLNHYEIPVISLVTDPNNLFSADSGIYVPGIHYDGDPASWTGNYYKKGIDWERDVHVEFYDANGHLGISQDAGIRVHGGATRKFSQKSMRITARADYGRKYFRYPLFEENETVKYREFLLRTSMGSWGKKSIFEDALASQIVKDLNFENLKSKLAIVYINGEYWGFHFLSERVSDKYIEYTTEVENDLVDMISGNYGIIVCGSNSHYANLIDFIDDNDLSQDDNYNYVLTQIDVASFIDYQIAEIFLKNYDWPLNNVKLWRPQYEDGKWRWIFYDLDAGFEDYNFNMLVHATENDGGNPKYSTFLFTNLLKNEHFKNQFIDRYIDLLESTFTTENLLSKITDLQNQIHPQMEQHISRWNHPQSIDDWEQDVYEDLILFAENRPCIAEQHLIDFFELEEYNFPCRKSVNDQINHSLLIAPNPNNGDFLLHNNSDQDYEAQLFIRDLSGKIVYHEDYFFFPERQKKHFQINNLASGTYLLSLEGQQILLSEKLVIVNP